MYERIRKHSKIQNDGIEIERICRERERGIEKGIKRERHKRARYRRKGRVTKIIKE